MTCSTSCDPAFLVVAWKRVRSVQGANTAGLDGESARYVESGRGVEAFLNDLRGQLKARTFRPQPVREVLLRKPDTRKRRRLGIPTVRDRVVQASLKLVLQSLFEADFLPCSYGFRPRRRGQDAIAEIHHLGSRSYEWVLEADIEARFDTIDHAALMDRVHQRVGDKRIVASVKASSKSRHPHGARQAGRQRQRHSPRWEPSRRCWPTSPCRCSTNTSPNSGRL